MSDHDLRTLELVWRKSGAVEDEARLLAAKRRLGLVTERGLVVAAGLGHEAAALVAPAVGLGPIELVETPCRAHVAYSCPRERAAAAMARSMISLHFRDASLEPYVETLAGASEWIACPCSTHHVAALTRLFQLPELACSELCCWDGPAAGILLSVALSVACNAPWPTRPGSPTPASIFAEERQLDPEFVTGLLDIAGQAVRETLVPWALGPSGPVD